ncbi:MAG: DeoR/GlpR family DNA-binding transcription regulator [Rhodospirillales bacterium]|jgi:DeoR family transcriptional regulator of aga operon|nr:DeoR/GlpR family DNA-binding transcription regulator [Rhodospirillales bacterium]
MIPAQRRGRILDVVRSLGGASIEHLAERLGASPSTVRRDLHFLTAQGYLERSHGGATVKTLPRTTFEPDREIGSIVAHGAKVAIGAMAASMVENGQSVIFDSSSTVLEAAKWVGERELEITAVTNDLEIGTHFAKSTHVRLVMLGGTLRPRSFTLTGDPGLGFLEGINVDLALMGIHSLAGFRLSETSTEVAAMKRCMIAAARRTILLVDSSKFEVPAFTRVCEVTEVDQVISDDGIPAEAVRELKGLGVPVALARIGGSR